MRIPGRFSPRASLSGQVRPNLSPETTTIRIVRPEPAPAPVKSDPAVEEVQATLKDLNFYAGEVDGIVGPATRTAIEAYQAKMGMTVTGKVDEDLLDQLGAAPVTAGIVPSPAPRETLVKTASESVPAPQAALPDERISQNTGGAQGVRQRRNRDRWRHGRPDQGGDP